MCLYYLAHKKHMVMLLKFSHEFHALEGSQRQPSEPFAFEASLPGSDDSSIQCDFQRVGSCLLFEGRGLQFVWYIHPGALCFWASAASRGSGTRALLFSLECALGILAVVLVVTLAHWFQWLLPVAALLCLLIVVPMALWCGFWQAVIVSLSAVLVQTFFTTRQSRVQPRLADPPTR